MRLIRAAMATMVLGAGAAVATGAGMPAGAMVVPTQVACYGSLRGHTLAQPIVGIAATPTTLGYWLVASDGGIFAFGDATFRGSLGGAPLSQPIVAVAADPDGSGYWLVGSDGGIFSFGAPFLGSLEGKSLSAPVVGISPWPEGEGYLLLGEDSAVYAFGDARYLGAPLLLG